VAVGVAAEELDVGVPEGTPVGTDSVAEAEAALDELSVAVGAADDDTTLADGAAVAEGILSV
jgi:hypothetical protein